MLLLYNSDYNDHMSFRVTQLTSLKQVTTSGAETEAAKAAVPLMAIWSPHVCVDLQVKIKGRPRELEKEASVEVLQFLQSPLCVLLGETSKPEFSVVNFTLETFLSFPFRDSLWGPFVCVFIGLSLSFTWTLCFGFIFICFYAWKCVCVCVLPIKV